MQKILTTLALAGMALMNAAANEQVLTLTSQAGTVTFNAANGTLLSVQPQGQSSSLLRSGEQGLWQARFQDGSEIDATQFSAGSATNTFSNEWHAADNAWHLIYRSAAIAVTIHATGRATGVEFTAEVTPCAGTLLDFALPGRLRFDPAEVKRCVFPANGNFGVGLAFRRAFFERQSDEHPAAWQPESVGPRAYINLVGKALNARPMHEPEVPLTMTPEGRIWLGNDLARRVDGIATIVNRAPAPQPSNLVLVDSPHGAWYYAHSLDGDGHLWRFSGFLDEKAANLSVKLVTATLNHLTAAPPARRTKIAVVALAHGPTHGSANATPVSAWQEQFQKLRAVRDQKITLVELTSPGELAAALAEDDFLAILNPYGEELPTLQDNGMDAMVSAIGQFVRGGGNWFEVGGYPFHAALRPVRYFKYSLTYPPAFADFVHFDTTSGVASLFGVQPLHDTPWAGATNHAVIFVPGTLGCGADERGGYADHAFAPFVKPGDTWRSPAVRLTLGQKIESDLQAYCADNRITRRLDAKMPPTLLARFKQSVLVFYAGTCSEKIAHLDQLPTPALVHYSDYLKGGFDKEYPDHLPPKPTFGTPAELRQFHDACHARGLLVMPYTNPTWWCDHPRGPTFLREGDAPLLRNLDGSLSYERYSLNDGYTVCHWHPAVQRANRETVRQFSEDYPVDVLFQDQNGARGWRYDLNPASPTPDAYTEGLISQVIEDSHRKPLSTEAGWDRVANFEAQLCGLSFQLVPTEHHPEWVQLLKYTYPPQTWDIFPLTQSIAHDKAALLYHDLGQFVTNPELVAWTLGLGFGMSYRVHATGLAYDQPREWLRWLDRLQKSVCARYIGEPLTAFTHDRGAQPTTADDGVLNATYGPVHILANLGPQPRTVEGHPLATHGFYATAPGMVAARLQQVGSHDFGTNGVSFVTAGNARKVDVWVFATPNQDIAIELPKPMTGHVKLTLDGGGELPATLEKNVALFHLPPQAGDQLNPRLWHATLVGSRSWFFR